MSHCYPACLTESENPLGCNSQRWTVKAHQEPDSDAELSRPHHLYFKDESFECNSGCVYKEFTKENLMLWTLTSWMAWFLEEVLSSGMSGLWWERRTSLGYVFGGHLDLCPLLLALPMLPSCLDVNCSASPLAHHHERLMSLESWGVCEKQ